MSHTEKRAHERIIFPAEARVSAKLSHRDGDSTAFPAIVMSVCEGGLGITTRGRFSGSLDEGQRLQLEFIKVGDSTTELRNLPIRVQWVVSEPLTDKLVAGLELDSHDAVMQGMLRQFMHHNAPD